MNKGNRRIKKKLTGKSELCRPLILPLKWKIFSLESHCLDFLNICM